MTPARREKLVAWLNKLADADQDSAELLARIQVEDQNGLANRAKLFREIARELEKTPVGVNPPPEPEKAATAPESGGKRRMEL